MRMIVGTWTRGQLRGELVLYHTHRQPLPPSYFSRVNLQQIKFHGRAIMFTGTTQIGVVQAGRQLTRENSYFEVQVLDKGKECAIAVGVAHREYPLDQMPGWRQGSIAYHMDDGKLFFQRGQGSRFGEKCGDGDVVGCGIELSEHGDSIISVYWTRHTSSKVPSLLTFDSKHTRALTFDNYLPGMANWRGANCAPARSSPRSTPLSPCTAKARRFFSLRRHPP